MASVDMNFYQEKSIAALLERIKMYSTIIDDYNKFLKQYADGEGSSNINTDIYLRLTCEQFLNVIKNDMNLCIQFLDKRYGGMIEQTKVVKKQLFKKLDEISSSHNNVIDIVLNNNEKKLTFSDPKFPFIPNPSMIKKVLLIVECNVESDYSLFYFVVQTSYSDKYQFLFTDSKQVSYNDDINNIMKLKSNETLYKVVDNNKKIISINNDNNAIFNVEENGNSDIELQEKVKIHLTALVQKCLSNSKSNLEEFKKIYPPSVCHLTFVSPLFDDLLKPHKLGKYEFDICSQAAFYNYILKQNEEKFHQTIGSSIGYFRELNNIEIFTIKQDDNSGSKKSTVNNIYLTREMQCLLIASRRCLRAFKKEWPRSTYKLIFISPICNIVFGDSNKPLGLEEYKFDIYSEKKFYDFLLDDKENYYNFNKFYDSFILNVNQKSGSYKKIIKNSEGFTYEKQNIEETYNEKCEVKKLKREMEKSNYIICKSKKW